MCYQSVSCAMVERGSYQLVLVKGLILKKKTVAYPFKYNKKQKDISKELQSKQDPEKDAGNSPAIILFNSLDSFDLFLIIILMTFLHIFSVCVICK